jgi:hypothetical protein
MLAFESIGIVKSCAQVYIQLWISVVSIISSVVVFDGIGLLVRETSLEIGQDLKGNFSPSFVCIW